MRVRAPRTGAFDRAMHAVTAVGKRIPVVLDVARGVVITSRRFRFDSMRRRTPLSETTAVFQAYGGRAYACSPRAIYRAMLRDQRYRDFELVWVLRESTVRALEALGGYDVRGLSRQRAASHEVGVHDTDLMRDMGEEALAELKRAVIVVYQSAEHYRALARAAYWITNSILPDHVTPGPGQSYVQAWHGTPLKRIGCDVTADVHATYSVDGIHRRYRREGARSTHMIAPSEFAAEKFISAFDLRASGREDIVSVTGYPRNDDLAGIDPARVAATRCRLGIPDGAKVVLYTPTWRDDEHASGVGFTQRIAADFGRMRRELGDGWVVLFRAHYLIANTFDFAEHADFVIDVSSVGEINDLFVVSDVLVCDYSSTFFDYANLGRPIVFYLYDRDHYADTVRGFYLDLSELPGPVTATDAELIEAIRLVGEPAAQGSLHREFRQRFCPLDDGHAAERALVRIMPIRS